MSSSRRSNQGVPTVSRNLGLPSQSKTAEELNTHPGAHINWFHWPESVTAPGELIGEYRPNLGPDAQTSASIPKVFLDCMRVRKAVFVDEQNIALANEFDEDDARSVHFVVYDTWLDPDADEEFPHPDPRKPIGTIRIVPFPHGVHPKAGRIYFGDKVMHPDFGSREMFDRTDFKPAEDDPNEPKGLAPIGYKDRATKYHDGQELYIKLGRLAVIKEFRGQGVASQLIKLALDWATKNAATTFRVPPSSGLDTHNQPFKWRGLVCIHAQEDAASLWKRHNFLVDQAMGKWYEEGIPHVGMFLRLTSRDGSSIPPPPHAKPRPKVDPRDIPVVNSVRPEGRTTNQIVER